MQTPPYTPDEALTHDTFHALLMALSLPGRVHTLPSDDALDAISQTLLDIETTHYTPDDGLAAVLARLGSRAIPLEQAAYLFYPTFTEAHLPELRRASVGTMLYPDTAATIFIAAEIGTGATVTLSGPGIPPHAPQGVRVAMPDAFWDVRAEACRYPLGWDVYLVDGAQVIGLPRTTTVQKG